MNRIIYFAITMLFSSFGLMAQNTSASGMGNIGIEDNRTVDPEQNAKWRSGEYPYSSKPFDMWEIGVSLGHPFIVGDVEADYFSGLGYGLHLRKALNYNISIKASFSQLHTKGLDARASSISVMEVEKTIRQNNLSSRLAGVESIHRNYKTTVTTGAIEVALNLGNILFHKPSTNWNFNLTGGMGFEIPKTKVNLFDGNANYDWASVSEGLNLTSRDDRKIARERLADLLDDSYETEGGVEKTIRALGDEKSVYPMFTASVGVTRKINDRFNIGLSHQAIFADNDLLDGFEFRSAADRSNNFDLIYHTALSLNVNLGSFEKRTEPLYWLNPFAPMLHDLAEVKSRPQLDLTDTDGDGVIDMLDQEPDTPPNAPVDVRGVVLDSDKDGIADYMDKEPFSTPGFDVDSDGVAQMPDNNYLTEDEINSLVNNKMDNIKTEWFLPMVNFDLNKYYVKPEFYGSLHHVATVMKNHPSLEIVVKGHTDNRGDVQYNEVLSYKRASAVIDYLVERYDLPRERFMIQYGGETNSLIPELKDGYDLDKKEEMQAYLNRRVEFYVATPEDKEMERPEGPDAGEGTPGSSKSGSKYSGNKNSGY
ncbi:OmpA family protein [Membranihabitans marinus]|uniref:OmpA family protein n=1 Tax=Membranihabitans marinus TaxID=1227546 RepID=UPI001F3A1FDD|nr:OmpA family protein [Membranihabitans marinus]